MTWVGDSAGSRWRRALLLGFALALGLLGAGLGAALVAVVWQRPTTRGQTLIELLKVFVSWPFAALVLGLAFGWVFRNEIRRFLAEFTRFKAGGVLFERQQAQVSADVEKTAERHDRVTPPTPDQLPVGTDNIQQDLMQQLQQARAELLHWWLRFLDTLLVPNTRIALAVLQNTPMTRETYHQFWKPRIPSQNERDAMLDALMSEHLVAFDNATMHLSVTPAGQLYLRYLLRFAQPPLEAPGVKQEPSGPAAP
jgi:hypothetical protein